MTFDEILQMMIGRWQDTIQSLTDAGEIHSPYYEDRDGAELPYYVTDWFKESGEPHYTELDPSRRQCYAIGRISHTSGTQDPSLPFETYAQTIEFELTANSRDRADIEKIFTAFSLNLKSQIGTVGEVPVVFKSDSLPTFSQEFVGTMHGTSDGRLFRTSWKVLCVFFPEMMMANDYSFVVDVLNASGTTIATGPIPFTKAIITDENEVRADSSSRMDYRFRKTTRQVGVQIEGLLTSSAVMKEIEADIMTGESFSATYSVSIRKKGVEIARQTWVRKSGNLVLAYGSFVAFTATFVAGF